MKIIIRDGNAELLKARPWTLHEAIDGLFETSDFIFLLSNMTWRLLHIDLFLKILIKGVLYNQLEQGHDKLTTENKILMEFIRATSKNVSK